MKLTPFGEAVRVLRLRLGLSMKSMADFMGISSSHMSGIEYGEKRLSQKHIDSAIAYFRGKANEQEIASLREAGEKSKDVVLTSHLSPDAKGLVAAFARRLQEGAEPPPEIQDWLRQKAKKVTRK
jgi:transcriptional regulator with XRE-family HTH domain